MSLRCRNNCLCAKAGNCHWQGKGEPRTGALLRTPLSRMCPFMFKPPRAKSLEWNIVLSLWGMLSSRPLTVALGYMCLHPYRQSEANRFPVELSHSRTHKDCWLKLEDRSHSARNDRLASLQKGNVPVIIRALTPPVCSLQQLRPRGDLALPHLPGTARVLPMLGTLGHITGILMSPVVFPHPHYEYFVTWTFPTLSHPA